MGGFLNQPSGVPAPLGVRFWAAVLDAFLFIITLGIGWLIWSVVLYGQATSPGKKMFGLVVVDSRTGELAGFGQMALREVVGKIVLASISSGLTTILGGLIILVNPTHAGIWDMIASTEVVRRD